MDVSTMPRTVKKKVTKKVAKKRPGFRPGKKVLAKKGTKKTVVNLDAARAKFLAIYSDPQDLRDEQDIAAALGVLPSQLAAWRNQPSFYEPGSQAFDRAFRGCFVTLKKTLLRQALDHSSQAAITRLLEMFGVLESKGTKIGVFVGGQQAKNDFLGKLTDAELDDEIALRLSSTTQADVVFSGGRVVPTSEILDAEYEELDCLDHGVGKRRVDAKRQT